MPSAVAERAARKLIAPYSLPVSISMLCKKIGVRLSFADLDNIGAYYLKRHAMEIIVVNSRHMRQRQRFSAAHEIGHRVLGHGPLRFSDPDSMPIRPNWQEVQANVFAAELLMPKLKLARFGFLQPEHIAQMCNVSIASAAIRAGEFGWATTIDDLL